MSRLQFFIDQFHAGLPVFRGRNECNCAHCEDVYNYGLTLTSELHASYICDVEAETGVNYFATIEERDDHENNLPDHQANQTV